MKLSVVITARNEQENIRDCLESVKQADEIVVVDDASKDRTVEICREYTDKIFINDTKDIVIGTVGRLSPEKGFEYLISAIREVVNEYPWTKVLIVGNGEDKYRLYL